VRRIIIIAHDMRSAHNVGSLLRTADGFGARVYLTGYTPYPAEPKDSRLPHLAAKLTRQIHKTALGTETDHDLWSHEQDVAELLQNLKDNGYEIIGLEQTEDSEKLPDYRPPRKVAILLGREVEGIEPELLKKCDDVVEIPMLGNKESFNVVEAATSALYHCRHCPF
jgi:23S rRNA (guanosine2251-2'-O)-methyltransferase